MANRPRKASLARSLTGWFWVTSLILAVAAPAAAQDASARVASARKLAAEGRSLTARRDLESLLASPLGRDPAVRLAATRALLDVCLESLADTCVATQAQAFVDAATAAPPANPALRAELAREAAYWFDAGRLAQGRPEVTAQIFDWPLWKAENAYNGELYLRRQLLASRVQLALGRYDDAGASADKALSLVASLRNPEAAGPQVAADVAELIGLLVEIGQSERAWGLDRAAGALVAKTLPIHSLGAVRFALTQARLREQVGDLAGAAERLDSAVARLRDMELEPAVRDRLLAQATTRRQAVAGLQGDHAASAAVLQGMDPAPTATGRPEAVERLRLRASLADPATRDEVAFERFQRVGRTGATFDAEALATLSQARDELKRRAAHQVLRLRARRDRLEREQVQAIMERVAASPPAAAGILEHDPARRLQLRDFARRIGAAQSALAKDGLNLPASAPVSLGRFQAALAPGEAALGVTPVDGGLAYLCVRRDLVQRKVAPADLARARIDGRILQAALTADHPPSESADTQFPAEAAVRLNDMLIRPMEGCLRAGDHIIWLPGVAGLDAPLAVLLPKVPPKREGGGYDLAAADWLMRDHSISYAGSASVIVAARAARPQGGDFDFLGVGDPVLGGETAGGESRGAVVSRGIRAGSRFEGLQPLPETKDELEASARGFATARLLLQDEATERQLRGQMIGGYRYLSFATHGLLRDDLQGLSEPALVLTPVSGSDALDDGLLTASEIADLNLRARFVALSACNTANFDLSEFFRDLPALSSAFAVAGVPATLGTLWPVDSETGKRVVTATFEGLRGAGGTGPAAALAAAQRAFLAAPPGRAYLHPRFWAPFVILGDGGLAPVVASARPAVTQAQVLTRAGGEILGVSRASERVAVRMISDADATGRHGAAVRGLTASGEAWRHDDPQTGASRLTVQLGQTLIVSGYRPGPAGRYVPVLKALDTHGALAGAWQGDGLARVDAFVLGGAATGGGKAVFAVGELNLRDPPEAGGGRLHVFEVDAALAPRKLFEVTAPAGTRLAEATLTPLGGDLLLTYTDRTRPPVAPPPPTLDDWEIPACLAQPTTWLELRDGRTGALKARRELVGQTVVAALAADKAVLLGGAATPACGEEGQASVLRVDANLASRPLYRDSSLGASEVRTLAALPGGATFVAASKDSVVDYLPPALPGRPADPYRWSRTDRTSSGLVLTIRRDGAVTPPRLLDSGSNVLVTAADASRPGDILLGGALGGEAALFHLDAGR